MKYETEQILLGSLLGDGGFNIPHKNYLRYAESHSKKQERYLDYKIGVFKKDFNLFKHHSSGIGRNMVYIYIKDGRLAYYYNLFYPNHKKIVTQEILDKLEPLAIAIWYCDDGNFKRGTITLATHCFGYESNLLIQKWFKDKYDIDFKIGKVVNYNKNGYNYFLRENKRDSLKFINLIKDYVPECMNYKIDIENEDRKYKEYYNRNRERFLRRGKEYYYNRGGSIKKREYQTKNKEKILQYKRNYHLKNKYYIDRYHKAYRIKNREKILQKHKEYYLKNNQILREHAKKYRENNKEIIKQKKREYYLKNKDKISQRGERYRLKNKEKIILRKKEYYYDRGGKQKIKEYQLRKKEQKLNENRIDPTLQLENV